MVESAIPPTRAFMNITVQTSPWAPQDTPVVANSSSSRVFYVSDGSIIFNVTTTPP